MEILLESTSNKLMVALAPSQSTLFPYLTLLLFSIIHRTSTLSRGSVPGINGKIKDIYKSKIPFAEIVVARDEGYAQSLVVVDEDSNSIISADVETRRFLFFLRINGKIKDIYKLKIPFAEIVDARDEEYAQSLVVVDEDSNAINGVMTIISAVVETRRFLFFL
nr:hypothetical protein [Tanacetum cinerariifolium]